MTVLSTVHYGIVKETSGTIAAMHGRNKHLLIIYTAREHQLPSTYAFADISCESMLSSNVTDILPTATGEPVTN